MADFRSPSWFGPGATKWRVMSTQNRSSPSGTIPAQSGHPTKLEHAARPARRESGTSLALPLVLSLGQSSCVSESLCCALTLTVARRPRPLLRRSRQARVAPHHRCRRRVLRRSAGCPRQPLTAEDGPGVATGRSSGFDPVAAPVGVLLLIACQRTKPRPLGKLPGDQRWV